MVDVNLDSVVGHAEHIIFDAREVLEELDPFSNGTYPEIFSAVNWLFPYVEESLEWCRGLDNPMEFFGDEDDSFTPAIVMKIILDHHGRLKSET